jgi:hypothetical protein
MQHRVCQKNSVLFMLTEQRKFVLVSFSKCKLILSYSFTVTKRKMNPNVGFVGIFLED